MIFKVDENLPVEVTEILREGGYDAVSVLDQELGGAEDPDVARICRDEGRILVTLDAGFGDLRSYPPGEHPGIVMLRPHTQEKYHLIQFVSRLLPVFAQESVIGSLWIVEEKRIRVRSSAEQER